MNSSQRIYFNSGNTGNSQDEKYVKVRLEQNIETLEFMSLTFRTEDAYQNFNSEYGVLVGRVIANEGVGIPNARISIFIPIDEEDKTNSEIYSVYPYETPRDKNNEGKRYNLLPRVSVLNEDGTLSPKQPFGSFPIKPEIVINETLLNVYKKYYKYTAITNDSGDYMMFGIPVGVQTVHLSVDITDIGEYSMNPAGMVGNLGYSSNLFTDNNSKIKPSNDLADLPHIETQEITVNVIPFWGDVDNFEIGITRQDFRIKAVLTMQFVIFGTSFTDNVDSTWGASEASGVDAGDTSRYLYRISNDANVNLTIENKRGGIITESIYYYPNDISDESINSLNPTIGANPISDMRRLDKSEYTSYKTDSGDFVYIINCNRRKKIVNEIGELVDTPSTVQGGIFTEFRGFIIFEYTKDDVPIAWNRKEVNRLNFHSLRYRFKFPQYGNTMGETFANIEMQDDLPYPNTFNWRKQHHTFSGGKIYSVARFMGTIYNNNNYDFQQRRFNPKLLSGDYVNWHDPNIDPFYYVGLIRNNNNSDADQNQINNRFPSSTIMQGFQVFTANWLNFAIHFPQIARNQRANDSSFSYQAANTHFNTSNLYDNQNQPYFFLNDNTQPIAGNDINTKWLARADLHWTDFIEVPAEDIVKIYQNVKNDAGAIKGFMKSERISSLSLNWDKYRNGVNSNSWNGTQKHPKAYANGVVRDDVPLVNSTDIYFYRGIDGADCISYLFDLGILRTT